MHLNLGSLYIPLNAATKTFAILAKRGAGKSYTGAVLAEEFFTHYIPFMVFDPIDVWWGLRLARDGKQPGLPVGSSGVSMPIFRWSVRWVGRSRVPSCVTMCPVSSPSSACRRMRSGS